MSSYANEKDELLDLLYRSLDDLLPATEQQRLAAGLNKHAWLREEQVALLRLRAHLSDLHPKSNNDFVDDVMKNILAEQYVLHPLVVQWRAIAAAACLALLIGGGVIFGSTGSWETEAILGLDEMELDDVYAFDE